MNTPNLSGRLLTHQYYGVVMARHWRLDLYCLAIRKAAKMRRIAYALHGVTADAERAFVPYTQPLREQSDEVRK